RQIVLLFVALIAMPLFSFKESARMLILGTPARRMLGIGPGPGDGTMTLEARIEFLTLSFFLAVGFVFVQVHHFYQGPHELWQTEGYRDGKIHGYDLQVMSPLNDASGIPTEGEKLVIVAIVGHVLHFRIFDDLGKVVVDTDEKRRTEHAAKIDELKRKLPSLWLPHELTESEKAEVIPAVTTIVDHSLKPLPGLKNGAYLKRCLIPYAFYSVYSLINYLAGVSIVLTLSVHAGISDLLWMNRWSGDYRQKCDEGIVGVMVLHRRFEREFLVRLGAVLERYYALLVFLLTGFAFKLWLDHINLSPRAYEFEFYAMAVGTTPLIAAYLVSTIFYRSAAESAASRAQAPEVFRSQHRLEDFYGKSIKRSMYLPISLLLLASIAINFVWELAKRLLGW
ncbi:MAG TPA: hypothetical protein VKA15_26930, partial [Isosphaeraceae bacterium]|nr:hypothetical protein [Isosphaeraceae bacterium]